MRRFFKILLAVMLCTTAMCQMLVCSYVKADSNTSNSTIIVENNTIQKSVQNVKSAVINSGSSAYSDEEVFLAAQLIHHEAHNQTYNGKVAVAEVLINRVKSSLFPNTVDAVVTQEGQFSHSRRIKNIQPSDVELRIARSVLNGSLRVFNDSDVLYFRNPKVTSGFSAKVDRDWGELDYVTYIGDHAFYSQNVHDMQIAEVDNADAVKNGAEDKSVMSKMPAAPVGALHKTTPKVEVATETVKDNDENIDEKLNDVPVVEVATADDLLNPEEPVFVDSEVMLANAMAVSVAMATEISTEEDDVLEEEIDEDDPVAVAQRQAKIDEKLRVQHIAELEAENKKANDAAAELAEANVQQAVDRVETLVKAGQVTIVE